MRPRIAAIGVTLVLVLVLGLGLGACRSDRPEIVVTLDTTFGVPCTIDAIHVEAMADHGPVAVDFPVGDPDLPSSKLPGSIYLYPLGDPREVTVTVTAMRAGEVFATASDTVTFDHESTPELRFVLDRSCVPGPCSAVGVGRFVGVPAAEPRRGCGDEGYSWNNALFVMRDACSMREALMGRALANADESEEPSPLGIPFPFRFYGAPVTQIWVGDNGYIGFGDARPDAINASVGMPRPLGDRGTFPGKGVLAFWDDLRTSAAGVCFAVSGAFPDRVLWITWKDACFASTTVRSCVTPDPDTLTFGIALEETTDRIYIGYRTMVAPKSVDRAKGNRATIGVTNAAPRGCVADLCSPEGTCQDGRRCGYTQFSAETIVDPLPTLEFDPQ